MPTMINCGKELIRIRSTFHKHPTFDDITWDMCNIFICFSVKVEDLHTLVSGAENVIALVGKGNGNNRVRNAIQDAVWHSLKIAKGYNLFTTNKIIIKLLYPKITPIKVCETEYISNFYEFCFGNPDGKEFDKLFEEESDDVELSDVISDSRVFSDMRFGDADSWDLKCCACEKESDDSEITALILASNLKPF